MKQLTVQEKTVLYDRLCEHLDEEYTALRERYLSFSKEEMIAFSMQWFVETQLYFALSFEYDPQLQNAFIDDKQLKILSESKTPLHDIYRKGGAVELMADHKWICKLISLTAACEPQTEDRPKKKSKETDLEL